MKDVKVSVIVPCYGVEKYLDRCMNSIVNQTLRDIEIILVDDGSPDKVPEMCDDWALRDSRIKVIHKENGGLGFARNSGLDMATGEYIAFVDSDDFVEVNMFELLYEEAKRSNADVVFSNTYIEGQHGHWTITEEVSERSEWSGEQVIEFLKDMIGCAPSDKRERKYQMSVWHSIYRRRIIEENSIRFHSEREIFSEDFPFQVDFLKQANRVVYIPEAFYHYCMNDTSLTHHFNVKKFDRILNLYNLMSKQTEYIPDVQPRLDKFFIGYSRSEVQSLLRSDVENKNYWIEYACDQLIGTGIVERYPMKSLRAERRVIYKMMTKKNILGIRILCILLIYIKKLQGRRL